MLPLKLEIENINSFTDRQTIDFGPLAADGLFCICGDTGAGKTTVLDSLIIALYGADRSSADERGGKDDYINMNADKAFVSFTFSFGGKEYAVERTFSRSGAATAYLHCDGALVGKGAAAVTASVEALIGLGRDQFTQVIVLEQGKFARFLTAKRSARIATVMKLFRLERFDLAKKANEYAASLRGRLNALNEKLGAYAGDTDAQVKAYRADAAAARKAADKLKETSRSLAARIEAINAKRAAYQAYLSDRARLEELERALKNAADALTSCESEGSGIYEERAAAAKKAYEDAVKRSESYARAVGCAAEYEKSQTEIEKLRNAFRAAKLARDSAEAAVAAKNGEIESISSKTAGIMSDIVPLAAALNLDAGDLQALSTSVAGKLAEAEREAADFRKESAKLSDWEKRAAVWQAAWEKNSRAFAACRAAHEEARAAYERAQKDNARAVLTAGLQAGDACPLCGGTLKAVSAGGDLSAAKEAFERAAEAYRMAESANAALTEQRGSLDRERAGISPVKPDTDADVCKKLAELAGEALRYVKQADTAGRELERAEGDRKQCRERLDGIAKDGERLKGFGASAAEKLTAELGKIVSSAEAAAMRDEAAAAAEKFKAEYEEAEKAARTYADRVKLLSARKAAADGAYRQAAESLKPAEPVDEAESQRLAAEAQDAEAAYREQVEREGSCKKAAADMAARVEEKRGTEKEKREVSARYDTADLLVRALHKGNNGDLVGFIAEAYIRSFTAGASERLSNLTGGKYTLEYSDGAFFVRDYLSNNRLRRVQTLSGGETFLASLSLAVAISDQISGGAYRFFFLDEGFGTLDEGLLESVSDALRTLSRDTLVGVVTHSPDLIERIPSRVTLRAADGTRGSTIDPA